MRPSTHHFHAQPRSLGHGSPAFPDGQSATRTQKRYAVLVAAFQLEEHDFDIVVAWDPQEKSMKDLALQILKSVTRQEDP